MTEAEAGTGVETAPEPTGLVARLLSRGLVVHVALYLLLLLLVWPLVDAGTPWTPDEGVYATQAAALDAGSWTYERPSEAIDPEGAYEAFDGPRPYTRHPLYAWILGRTYSVGGAGTGIIWSSVLSAVLVAASAWHIGRELRPGSERLAFWLAAASPVAFSAFVLWSHAPGAAAAGWATVGALRLSRGRASGALDWALTAGGTAVAVLLRSEGLIFAVALAIGLGVVAVAERSRRALGASAAVVATAMASLIIDTAWMRSVRAGVGPSSNLQIRGGNTLGDIGFLDGRIEGFQRAFLDGGQWSVETRTLGQLAVVMLVLATFRVASRGVDRVASALLLAAVAVYVVRVVVDPVDPISGLAPAWPVGLVALLGFLPQYRGDRRATVLVGAVLGAFTAGVLATQYGDAGGLQWGGRFFVPAIPLLAGLAASALRSRQLAATHIGAACLAVVMVVTSVGLVGLRLSRNQHADVVAAVDSIDAELYATIVPSLPRVMWREHLPWFALAPRELPDALEVASEAGVDHVVLGWVDGFVLDTSGWEAELVAELPYDGFEVQIYDLTRD